jgi:anti-anti-sigma factor
MKITTQDYNDISVIAMQGDLDRDYTEAVGNIISDLIRRRRAGIVLDMENIGFIDSIGLEKLLWIRDYCRENNCQLRLAGLDENCGKILEITRLDSEFDRYGELTEAVKSFV